MLIVTVHDLMAALSAPDVLMARSQAFAVLDAVFGAQYPIYTFTPEWAPGVSLAR